MNKIIIFCLFFVSLLSACNITSKKSELTTVKESVESAERIVKRYDSNVQSAIDARSFKYISVVTKEAIDSTDINLNNLKKLLGKTSDKELLEAAISYVESLRELILVEEGYSKLADLPSVKEAQKLDNEFLLSSQKAQLAYTKYSSLLEALPAE